MQLEQGLVTYLLTRSAVTDLVGSRISPNRVAQGVDQFPRLVYRRISGRHEHTLAGASRECNARLQLTCQAQNYGEAKALAEALRNSLDGFRGSMGGATVTGCHLDNDPDGFKPPSDGSDDGVHEVMCDYLIQHRVSQPTL